MARIAAARVETHAGNGLLFRKKDYSCAMCTAIGKRKCWHCALTRSRLLMTKCLKMVAPGPTPEE